MTAFYGYGGEAVDASGAVSAVGSYRNYTPGFRLTPLALAGPALVLYHQLVVAVPEAGLYEYTLSALVSGTNAGSQFDGHVIVDAVDLGGPLFNQGLAGGIQSFAATLQLNLTATSHTLELWAGQPAGAGTTTVLNVFVSAERKA